MQTHAAPDAIPVRKPTFDFHATRRADWFDDNPYLSALLASMSVSFPGGERFFIRSVLHYAPQIHDPALREAIRGFAGQEASHTRAHLAFNRMLEEVGVPAKAMEDFVERRLVTLSKTSDPALNLARTVALEHFTAILAMAFLEHPEVLDRMGPEAAELWGWHAVEELEHRAVAFDVYRATVDDEGLRRRVMAIATVLFLVVNAVRTAYILRCIGGASDLRAAVRAVRTLVGRGGVLEGLGPRLAAFYRRDFHPAAHDVSALLARGRARYVRPDGASARA